MQDIVYSEAQGSLVIFEERFRGGGIPEHFVLFETASVTGVGCPVDVAFEFEIPRQIEGRIAADGVVPRILVVLFL